MSPEKTSHCVNFLSLPWSEVEYVVVMDDT